MKRIKVIFPKPGTSRDITIKVGDDKQFQIKLTTFGDTDSNVTSLKMDFLDGTSENFPERGDTVYLDGIDDSYQLSNGDVLVAGEK